VGSHAVTGDDDTGDSETGDSVGVRLMSVGYIVGLLLRGAGHWVGCVVGLPVGSRVGLVDFGW
jgi:hypothetical protein